MACPFLTQGRASENTKDTPAPITVDFKENRLKHTATGRVETIIDAHTVLMNDGKIIRLLGFEYPENAKSTDEDFAVAGKAVLEKMMKKGDEFLMWQTLGDKFGRKNRMGHALAHLQNKKTGEWVNGAMVAGGYAFVKTEKSNPDLAKNLYALEDAARKDGKGIWKKDSGFAVLSSDDAQDGNGRFVIVEGMVMRAATSKNNVFLNFGKDSKSDFTVMIAPPVRKIMARGGIDPLSLAHKKIRVRGWVRDWNGPFMDLDGVERLEILSTEPPTNLNTGMPTEPSTSSPKIPVAGQSNP